MNTPKSVSIALICLFMTLSACTTQKVQEEIETVPSAIPFAINRALEFYTIVDFCSGFGPEYEQKANNALKAWNARNWIQVFAADANYSKQLASQSIDYKGEKIALAALKLVADNKEATLKQLTKAHRSRTAQQNNCDNKLAEYENGSKDISVDTAKSDYLKHLALQEERIPKMYSIPLLAGSLKPLSDPGRSLYTLEKEMASNNCSGGEILTLNNNWPDEAYGVFCKNNSSLFVSCEWGNCTVRK